MELRKSRIDGAPIKQIGGKVPPLRHPFQRRRHLGLRVLGPALVGIEPTTDKVGNQRKVIDCGERCALLQPPTVVVKVAAVFGRAPVLAADADRILPTGGGRQNLFEPDVVLPPGTEVVEVGEALTRAESEAGQRDGVSVGNTGGPDGVPILPAMNAEAVQVDVFPPHSDLDDVMELGNRRIALDEDAAPDQRGHVAQDNPELVNADGCCRLTHGSAFYATATSATEPAPGL